MTGSVHITDEYIDPRYNEPYIDVNELRTEPVPHRYVHGGFKGTDAKFSFYFPPKEAYQGRFFHNTYPMAVSEDIGPFPIAFDVAIGNLGFTIDSGAYYVQTNLGGADRMATPPDPSIGAYRVNAAAAKYSRVVAAEMYGPHRAYGYLFGGSGGSKQVMGTAENTSGVWDGFVPYVLGTEYSVPNVFTIRQHVLRVLRQRDKFPGIMDALNPGGSGDPYAGLNEEERAALREATLFGYPLRGWWNHEDLNSGYFSNVAPMMPLRDPTYAEDFWSKPGYLGTDPTSSIAAERFTFETTVAKVGTGTNPTKFPKVIELASVPGRDFVDAHVMLLSGAAAGRSTPVALVEGKTVGFAIGADRDTVMAIQLGDKVRIDNAWGLAAQTYHRHQVPPTTEYTGWNQYRDASGAPIYPQRKAQIGPTATVGVAGAVPVGRVTAKVLVVEAMMDIDALPWQADWYRARVKKELGAQFDDMFALWFIDHAQHDDPQTTRAQAYTVSFAGALQQALRDLATWVEKGIKPLQTTYKIVDTQVDLPPTAAARGGIQPVIDLKANGGVRADVKVGEPVTFTATIEVPPKAGKVVSAEWDFEGVGTYPVRDTIAIPETVVRLTQTHAYTKPGTYFPVLRAASQRDGNTQTPYGRIQNLGRARVVVT